MGTGDGRFILDQAKTYPRKLCIGIDAAPEAMAVASRSAAKNPARGGLPNALFLWESVETLPPELFAMADEITINYPWGSLLRGLVVPDLAVLGGIGRLARPNASLNILINLSVFENAAYCQRLKLPPLTPELARNELVTKYRNAGIHVKHVRVLDKDVPNRTTWGQKLIRGSGRKTLLLEAIIG